MPRADAAQIRALVVANRRPDDRRNVLAVHADPDWSGPDLLDGPDAPVRVVPCRSPLAVREALFDHEQRAAELLVLVTERWLIDDLIALAPAGGWPDRQPLGGVLDAHLAWRAWQHARLGLADPPDGIPTVLALGDRPEAGAALAELDPERRAPVAQRWAGGAEGPVPVMVDLLATGHGADLVALGLVAQALWSTTDDPVLAHRQTAARARLEGLLGRDRLDQRAAAAWGDAAEAALEAHDNAPAVLDAAA